MTGNRPLCLRLIIARRPAKKRRVSPASVASQSPPQSTYYLGSFIVGNAWSTVKGKGYTKSGDKINIEREAQDVESFRGTSAAVKGKKGKATDKGKKKQLSIATMMKHQQPKISKKKTNTVVRLTNSRGFGVLFLLSISTRANVRV
jgi:DNA repair protein RAD5